MEGRYKDHINNLKLRVVQSQSPSGSNEHSPERGALGHIDFYLDSHEPASINRPYPTTFLSGMNGSCNNVILDVNLFAAECIALDVGI